MIDMFEHLEQSQDVCLFVLSSGDGQVFDGRAEVRELRGPEGGVGALMGSCDVDDGRGWVDARHSAGVREARGGFGEDAAAAADVEVSQPTAIRRAGAGGEAGGDEGVAERVHQVEEAGGAVRVPPGGGEAGEVGRLGRGDGGVGSGMLGFRG